MSQTPYKDGFGQISVETTGKITGTDEDGNPVKVVIQKVLPSKGNGRIIGDRQIQVRIEPETRKDAQTWPQIRRRIAFKRAVSEWQNMTQDERDTWKRKARIHNRIGYNRFITAYMHATSISMPDDPGFWRYDPRFRDGEYIGD